MTTFADIVEQVDATLHAYTQALEEMTSLTGSITSGQTGSFTVDDVTQVSRGLIQIDDELLWVQSVDAASSTVSVPAWGRAQQGSTAASHSAGTKIVNNPRFPRARIKSTINEVIGSLYPDLFVVLVDESQTSNAVVLTYQLPQDAVEVIDLAWQTIGPTKVWSKIRRYRTDFAADDTVFPTGKAVDIYSPMTPGRPIKITYKARPTALVADSDAFGLTGFEDDFHDAIVWGVCARMLIAYEAARLNLNTVQNKSNASDVQAGQPANASARFMQMFQQRVQQERRALLARYPTFQHTTF